MRRSSRAAVAGCSGCLAALAMTPLVDASTAAAGQAATPGITARVTPSNGLVGGQTITVTGRGLGKPPPKDAPVWFVTECTSSVRGHMDPMTDTPHCDITHALSLRVSRNGTFSARFHVTTGIVGDGYCGTPGHASCVIGVGNARGQGTVVPVTFLVPPPAGSKTP